MIARRGLPILLLSWVPLSGCHLARQADVCQEVAGSLKKTIGPGTLSPTAEPDALRKAASAYRKFENSLEPLRKAAPHRLVASLGDLEKSVRGLDDQLVRAAAAKEQDQPAIYRNLKRQIESSEKRLRDAVAGFGRVCRGS